MPAPAPRRSSSAVGARASSRELRPGHIENSARAPPRRSGLAAEHRIYPSTRPKAALAAVAITSLALSLLDEHRRDFPRSPSADIRDLMRVRIRCGKGNAAAAKAVAEQYPGDLVLGADASLAIEGRGPCGRFDIA